MVKLLQLALLGCLFFDPTLVSPSVPPSRLSGEPAACLPLPLLGRGGIQAEQRGVSRWASLTARDIQPVGRGRNILKMQGLRGGKGPEDDGGGGEADMEIGEDPQSAHESLGGDEAIDGDEEVCPAQGPKAPNWGSFPG